MESFLLRFDSSLFPVLSFLKFSPGHFFQLFSVQNLLDTLGLFLSFIKNSIKLGIVLNNKTST